MPKFALKSEVDDNAIVNLSAADSKDRSGALLPANSCRRVGKRNRAGASIRCAGRSDYGGCA
jgi:hypothetical protein